MELFAPPLNLGTTFTRAFVVYARELRGLREKFQRNEGGIPNNELVFSFLCGEKFWEMDGVEFVWFGIKMSGYKSTDFYEILLGDAADKRMCLPFL